MSSVVIDHMESNKRLLRYQRRTVFHQKILFDANYHQYVVDKKVIGNRHVVDSLRVEFCSEQHENIIVPDSSESSEKLQNGQSVEKIDY
jgi:hypothetical protein